MKYRSLFISDVHLGTRHCKAEMLLDFLRTVDTDTLYLVGDIVDLVAMRRKTCWSRKQTAVVRKILKLANKGTRVVYVPGNHDHWVRDLVGSNVMGIEIVQTAVHTTADGRRLYVTHGDEFDLVLRHGWLVRTFGSALYEALMAIASLNNGLRRRFNLSYWSLSAHVKERSGRAREFIRAYRHAAMTRAEQLGMDGTICGHIHRADLFTGDRGTCYCNTGDWVEHCTALAEDEAGRLHIVDWANHFAPRNNVLRMHPGERSISAPGQSAEPRRRQG